MKVREYYVSTKQQLEEYIEKLKLEFQEAQSRITALQNQITEEGSKSAASTETTLKLEAELQKLNSRETKLSGYIDQLTALGEQFPFISLIHPAHALFIKKTPLNTLNYLFNTLDRLDSEKREDILSWAYGPIIQPRYQESISRKETLGDLRIDEVSYEVFKRKCWELSKVVEERLLSFAIVSFTLQCILNIADSTSIDEVQGRYHHTIEYLEKKEHREDEDKEDSSRFADYVRNLQQTLPERLKEYYSSYEYFCENVVEELLLEDPLKDLVKTDFNRD